MLYIHVDWSFYHSVIPTLAIIIIFVLKSVLSDTSTATPDFFYFHLYETSFFQLFSFSLYVSLYWSESLTGSCRWVLSCFTHSATICLLIEAFSLFSFKVIIYGYILIGILFIVFLLLYSYSLFLLLISSLVVWWLSIMI